MARTYSVSNLQAITDAIQAASVAGSESTLRKAAAAGATVFKNEVILRVPKETGELAKGVTVTYVPEDSVTGALATYLVTFVGDYPTQANGKPGMRKRDVAGWLEFGTSKMAARPFVRPAYEAKRKEAAQAVIDKIQEAVKSGK